MKKLRLESLGILQVTKPVGGRPGTWTGQQACEAFSEASSLTGSRGGEGLSFCWIPKWWRTYQSIGSFRGTLELCEVPITSQGCYVLAVLCISLGPSGFFGMAPAATETQRSRGPTVELQQLLQPHPFNSSCGWSFRFSWLYLSLVPVPWHTGSSWRQMGPAGLAYAHTGHLSPLPSLPDRTPRLMSPWDLPGAHTRASWRCRGVPVLWDTPWISGRREPVNKVSPSPH